jgi:hypothetical protein
MIQSGGAVVHVQYRNTATEEIREVFFEVSRQYREHGAIGASGIEGTKTISVSSTLGEPGCRELCLDITAIAET